MAHDADEVQGEAEHEQEHGQTPDARAHHSMIQSARPSTSVAADRTAPGWRVSMRNRAGDREVPLSVLPRVPQSPEQNLRELERALDALDPLPCLDVRHDGLLVEGRTPDLGELL